MNPELLATTSREVTLNAILGVCSIIAEVTPKLDSAGSMDPTTAEAFLQRLQSWSATLPASMRHFKSSADETMTLEVQEHIVGNIHASCIYYFAVLLITRPFLISHLMNSLADNGSIASPTTAAEVIELAQACIDAAMLMANMCYEALQSGVLLKQMCIMK